MAIEKMKLVSIVGQLKDLDHVCKDVILSGLLHPERSIDYLDITDFTNKNLGKEDIKKIDQFKSITPYVEKYDYSEIKNSLENVYQIYEEILDKEYIDEEIKKFNERDLIYNYEEVEENLNKLREKIYGSYNKLNSLTEKKNNLIKLIRTLTYIKNIDIPIEQLTNLNHFKFSILKINKENVVKIKHIYENIPSLIFDVFKEKDFDILISFTPLSVLDEVQRILKPLNVETIDFNYSGHGSPKEIEDSLERDLNDLRNEIEEVDNTLKTDLSESLKNLIIIDNSLYLQLITSELKRKVSVSEEFFYITGWIPRKEQNKFEEYIVKSDNIFIFEVNDMFNQIAPTKLNNNKLFKPFEAILNLYGTPDYSEIDPTPFLAITYTLIFGSMFGDIGQGLVLLLAGLFMVFKLKSKEFGGILVRLGISSTVFGFFYGSLFGLEGVIHPMLMNPMDDINVTLIVSIGLGVILLIISYILGIINSIKKKDIKKLIFGTNGIAGLSFYILFILLVLSIVLNKNIMPIWMFGILFILVIAAIILNEPLSNMILNKKPLFSGDKADYFIEEGFGIVEVILTMFSNTLSFVRVGAFALSHVALFLAVETLSEMVGGVVGIVVIYIVGNIIAIALEGMVVVIQGLRLQFNEMFSKYYSGSGMKYDPIKVNF